MKKCYYRDTENQSHGSIEKGKKKKNCLKDAGKTSQREIKFEQAEREKDIFVRGIKKDLIYGVCQSILGNPKSF